ncbi:hypothetical protein LAWASA_4148 [Lawsonibacter asaccharolyticus]|nr:hypothetical protein LAWASA_4148 [Lawsonibacter asaccharolyticus]
MGGKSSVSILSASDILSANKNLINGGIDIARSSSSILSSVGSGSSIPSNSKPPIHSSTPKAPGGSSGAAVDAAVPDGKDILYIINALEEASETVSPDSVQP